MAGRVPSEQLLSALSSEHFVMQGAISTAVNEQQARASMFLYSLSGALVALGLMADSPHSLTLVALVLPALFVTGLVTTLRLVDVSMESLLAFVNVARIRARYRSIDDEAAELFDPAHGRWPDGASDSGHLLGPLLGILTTAASMIGMVNGFVGGVGLALLLATLAGVSKSAAVIFGALFVVAQIALLYR